MLKIVFNFNFLRQAVGAPWDQHHIFPGGTAACVQQGETQRKQRIIAPVTPVPWPEMHVWCLGGGVVLPGCVCSAGMGAWIPPERSLRFPTERSLSPTGAPPNRGLNAGVDVLQFAALILHSGGADGSGGVEEVHFSAVFHFPLAPFVVSLIMPGMLLL